MSDQKRTADQAARSRALDPSRSFVVQAPAGSGKTALLTQRFLVLLAGVNAPEEIVAMTFTRKAAAEMRQRILQALEGARRDQPPDKTHERHSWKLARRALARDAEQGWQLLDHPTRLRIQTIDSLCTALARQMPILSRMGSVPAIAEDADALYLEAARKTIAELGYSTERSDAIAHLVQHLDNRLDKLQALIVTMLARRDQWLHHVADPKHPGLARENLEATMARLLTNALRELAKHFPETCVLELLALARFAAKNLEGKDSPIARCRDLQNLPEEQVADRQQWEGLSALLLTKEGSWRKSVNKGQGFPAASSAKDQAEKARLTEMKQRMLILLTSLQAEDAFRERLALLQELPPHQYTEGEWETLKALVELLRVAAAHLELVFSEQGQVDFPALAQAAIQALGEPEAPTDLALELDYRIRHLLVDEFQDASRKQYELLNRLTAGWQPDDGHSLFVVGDPMQSIYRFREAEVGLFLSVREHGMAQVPLESLRLTVNFRSQQGIVDWINHSFPDVLPKDDNVAGGAVCYAPSTFFHPPLEGDAVPVYPSLERDDIAEALQVVSIVQREKAGHTGGTTAILVRSRTHLVQIVAQLQKAKLRFQAVEIERLAMRPVIQDLLALTRALSHIGDRIAWLAVLRAPYCGLTLKDLYVLAGDDSGRTLIDCLHQDQRLGQLSEDGRRRIARVLPLLDMALSEQARCPLRNKVEGLWIALGGPACVADKTDLEEGKVYFQLLEALGKAGEVPNMHTLNLQVQQLFALSDLDASDALQLMTVHKAKGLEFDTVIIPGLGRRPGHDDEKLLHWLERARESGGTELLLAPIAACGEEENPISVYLKGLDKAKGRYEDSRLLYVAATRAKQDLHLLGHLDLQEREGGSDLKPPPRDSLLARLWPVVKSDFQSLLADRSIAAPLLKGAIELPAPTTGRTRLASDWSLPSPPQSLLFADMPMARTAGELIEFDWAEETARHLGTVVHRLLQHMGKMGVEQVEPSDLRRFRQIAPKMLVSLGVPDHRLQDSLEAIYAALHRVLEDKRGQWILSGQHEKTSSELALSGLRDGSIDHIVIDRTFVDKKGTRWIIDYKTGAHTGGGLDAFLDREQQRYRQQLERYASIMSKTEYRPIRLGLYFPLLSGWREWPF